ncbi:MAG: LicD family protein [Bacteroidales bacterium]|jgi:hypothetical protein|nr:LicD family protein [Bacteroidales bacterium]
MIRKLLVSIALKLGLYKDAVNIGTKFIHKKLGRKMKKHGLEALIQADKALKSADSFCFFAFGTLLGAYRDKNFISSDKDLDLGILAENYPSNLTDLLKDYGFKHLRQFHFKNSNEIIIDVYMYKGVQIDFFKYYNEGDDLYCYFGSAHEELPYEQANATNGFPAGVCFSENKGFSKINFLGYDFYAPENIEQWLISVYGKSFMIPKKNWLFYDHISEENLRVKFINDRLYRENF